MTCFDAFSVGAAGPKGDTGPVGPAGVGAAPIVAALPGSPADGQEVIYRFQQTVTPADAKWTYWHLRWDAAAGCWLPVGAQDPILAQAGPGGTNFSAGAWGNFDANDPVVTLPRAGDYDVQWGNGGGLSPAGSNSWCGLQIAGVDPPLAGDLTTCLGYTTGQWTPGGHASRKCNAMAAGTVIKMRYQTQNIAGGMNRTNAYIRAFPRRITG